VTVFKAGTQVVVARVAPQDPCWQLAGTHVFGIEPDGRVAGGVIVELAHDAIPNENGSFALDGVQAVDNDRFGNFIGSIQIDAPTRSEGLDDYLHDMLGNAGHPPPEDPFDPRERRGSSAGDPVCFTHAFVRPHLRIV